MHVSLQVQWFAQEQHVEWGHFVLLYLCNIISEFQVLTFKIIHTPCWSGIFLTGKKCIHTVYSDHFVFIICLFVYFTSQHHRPSPQVPPLQILPPITPYPFLRGKGSLHWGSPSPETSSSSRTKHTPIEAQPFQSSGRQQSQG